MVRAALRLYQVPTAEEPSPFVPFPSPTGPLVDPLDKLRARFASARKLLAAGDLISAGALLRTIVEQRLRSIVVEIGSKPKQAGAAALFTVCVSRGVFATLDRKLIALALDVGNKAAHAADGLEADHVVMLALVARRLIGFRPAVVPNAATSGKDGAA